MMAITTNSSTKVNARNGLPDRCGPRRESMQMAQNAGR
jgi:hypothetical protein